MSTFSEVTNESNLFFGWVKADQFKFSLKAKRPNSFIPLIFGTIEATSSGCIIFIKYRLFPTTKFYLLFWSLFILGTGVLISYQYHNFYFIFPAIGLALLINWVAWANFKLQKDLSRRALLKTLE